MRRFVVSEETSSVFTHFCHLLHLKDFTDFVEAGNDVAEVDPGRPRFRHLVKQVIPEKLQQVAVARLRPRRVLLKPDFLQNKESGVATGTQTT